MGKLIVVNLDLSEKIKYETVLNESIWATLDHQSNTEDEKTSQIHDKTDRAILYITNTTPYIQIIHKIDIHMEWYRWYEI